MEFFLACVQSALGLSLIIMAGVQAKRGTVPLLSNRNFFLFGVMIFQITSAALAFLTKDYWETPVTDPGKIGFIYSFVLIAFIVMFEAVYRTGWFTFGMTRRVLTKFPIPSDGTIMGLAVAMAGAALLFRFVLIFVPVFGVLSSLLATCFAAAGAGLISWALARKMLSPVRLTLAVVVIGAAFVVTTYHAFGRRDLLSVMTGCLWGAYHGHFRYVSLRRAFLPLAAAGLAGLVVVSAFTATRGHDNTKISQSEMNSRMLNADIGAGLIDLLSGQYAAPISMWLVESRPDAYPYNTLHTFRYAATNIIPREWYPEAYLGEKPISLGLSMVPEANLQINRAEGFTVGCGLVGHIYNDNPWIALPFYAILMGVIVHIMDRALSLQPGNPFVIIPVGGTLGDLIAISRGEMGLYIFRSVLGVTAVYIGLHVIAKIMVRSGWNYIPQYGEDGETAPTLNMEPTSDYSEVA